MTTKRTIESKRSKKARNLLEKIRKQESQDKSLRMDQRRLENYERIVSYLDNGTYITTADTTTIDRTYWSS